MTCWLQRTERLEHLLRKLRRLHFGIEVRAAARGATSAWPGGHRGGDRASSRLRRSVTTRRCDTGACGEGAVPIAVSCLAHLPRIEIVNWRPKTPPARAVGLTMVDDRRGPLRAARCHPGAVPRAGDASAEVRLPLLRGRGGAGTCPGTADRGRPPDRRARLPTCW